MKQILAALVSGFILGIGLMVSQMTNPDKVLNFLDVTGQWDPSLLLVLGGAVVTTTLFYRRIFLIKTPLLETRFYLPETTVIDRALILGALLFGIGWGLIGYCPGAAIARLGIRFYDPLIAVSAMIAGMIGYQFIFQRKND
ncbi:MAG TPA: YeeE/YedE family protein [Methylococcaceae bacterium]|nr:YeeE/YedE family protein [Methylococcaceae bacterium]